jgi:teichuronic acid exporter
MNSIEIEGALSTKDESVDAAHEDESSDSGNSRAGELSWPAIKRHLIRTSSWFAIFKFLSQVLSWTATVFVARLLQPEDYGLMEMATIITGYAMRFGEMGLGAAIIQRPHLNEKELSSLFWFILLFSCLLGASCFGIAELSMRIFNEPRLVPLTRSVAAIFIFQGLLIIPLNLLKKKMEFAAVGKIEIASVIISALAMIIMAHARMGAWTLMGGWIVLAGAQTLFYYAHSKWFPAFHFSFREVREYLRFGFIVVVEGTLYYLNRTSDKFFAGRVWTSAMLGHYTFALQLALLPTEKITVLINQIAFPTFSTLQNRCEEFRVFYLSAVRMTAAVVVPLFVCGFLAGEDLIIIFFTEKWRAAIELFKYLCLAQIVISLNAVNSFVHIAMGRPERTLYYNLACACIIPVSFYYAVQYGLNAVLIPWFTSCLLTAVIWILITIRSIGVAVADYLKSIMHSVIGSIVMALVFETAAGAVSQADTWMILQAAVPVFLGGAAYSAYMAWAEREMLRSLIAMIRGQKDGVTTQAGARE